MIDLVNRAESLDLLDKNISKEIFVGEYDREAVTVSIVVPTFKRSDILLETLNSCEKIYNNRRFEIIIVFNGQNEAQRLEEFINAKGIKNISVFENRENIGMFQNWNQGISLSNGKWICMMHDDDMFEEGFFELVPDMLEKLDEKVAYINFNGKTVCEEVYSQMPKEKIANVRLVDISLLDVEILGVSPFYATTCGTLIKKEPFVQIGGVDVKTWPSGDVLFPLKLINNGYKCLISKTKINFYRKQVNASLKKEVMEQFIYFYGELQKVIYKDITGLKRLLYKIFKECLYFKSVWHVFLQAKEHGVELDSQKPDERIQKTLRYKLLDIFQRLYWKIKRTFTVENRR